MADERTYPCLPCPEIDDSIAFYESLGFRRTYRQVRPNPYAVVIRDDLQIHLFGIDGFDPAESYGSAIVAYRTRTHSTQRLPQACGSGMGSFRSPAFRGSAGPGNAMAALRLQRGRSGWQLASRVEAGRRRG